LGGNGGDGVALVAFGLDAGARLRDAGVGFQHEFVEVDASGGRDRDVAKEEVHQHTFAAPNPAMASRPEKKKTMTALSR
jgi:hypothetical protein